MSTRISGVAFVVLAMAYAFAAAESDGGAAAKQPQVVVAKISAIHNGTIIVRVDLPPGSPPGGTFPLKTDDSTVITIDGEKKSRADLAVGMEVKITFAADGNTATAVVVGEKKATTGPAK